MPPSTLQARIKAFEALGMGASKQVLDTVAIHPEPDLLDSPLSSSPTAPSIPPIAPTVYTPSTSPGSLHHRSSLVDLKDWVIDDGPLRPGSPTAILNGYSPKPFEPAPLISFESEPPKLSKAPPLPPRKASYSSLRSVSAPATSPTQLSASPSANMLMSPDADYSYPPNLSRDKLSDGTRRTHGHAQASSVSSFHSVSLSSDSGDPTAVPISPLHAFSMEREWTVASNDDGESLDESFENVSAPSSFLPPITLPPRPQKPPTAAANANSKPPPPPLPPKLPQRPPSQHRGSGTSSLASRGSSPSSTTSPILALTPSASSSAPSLTNTSTRRVPPPLPITSPPPPAPPRSRPPSARTSVQSTATTTSASDRSSLFSTNSRTSFSSRTSVSPSKSSKPPVGTKQPSPPRARYDALFVANVRVQHAKRKPPPPPVPIPAKRQNAGWRGLSMDLDQTVSSAATSAAADPGPDARLDGRLVCKIWLKSGLEPQRLRDIWNECDMEGLGSLDRDAFAQGMTKIDEELRRAQVLGRAGAGASSGASSRTPRRAPSRPILR